MSVPARVELSRRIDSILEALSRPGGLPLSDERRRRAFEELMAELYELGRVLTREPSLREAPELERLDQVRQAYAEESLFEVLFFASRLSQRLSALVEAEGWTGVCRRRSSLAFFIELLGQGLELEPLPEDLADMDTVIRELSNREGYLRKEEIPSGIPSSHWWWWAPGSPPA